MRLLTVLAIIFVYPLYITVANSLEAALFPVDSSAIGIRMGKLQDGRDHDQSFRTI